MAAMNEPSVTILATCPDGHQTEILPENCFRSEWCEIDGSSGLVTWECPRCVGELAGKVFEVRL